MLSYSLPYFFKTQAPRGRNTSCLCASQSDSRSKTILNTETKIKLEVLVVIEPAAAIKWRLRSPQYSVPQIKQPCMLSIKRKKRYPSVRWNSHAILNPERTYLIYHLSSIIYKATQWSKPKKLLEFWRSYPVGDLFCTCRQSSSVVSLNRP